MRLSLIDTGTMSTERPSIVLAGGTGTIGRILSTYFLQAGWQVTVLTRKRITDPPAGIRFVLWDAVNTGTWGSELNGATALVNLVGRSVDCRYTARNKAEILNSRVRSTELLGAALSRCPDPPKVWINLSSATVYRHAEDRAMDEETGELGSDFSPQVVLAWEKAFFTQAIPQVRQVAVRCAMVFSEHGGAFPRFRQLVRMGLGGQHGSGKQYVSWVHATDVARFFHWLVDHPEVKGIINLAAPQPVPERVLMRALRERLKPRFHIDVPAWVLPFGALLMRTETELVLKSRRVVPTKALGLGFRFTYPTLDLALDELCNQQNSPRNDEHPATRAAL